MATVRLTNGRDVYTTKDGDEFVFALRGNDKITIQGFFYDEENDQTRVTVYGGPGNDEITSVIEMSGQAAYGGPGDDHIVMRGGDDDGGAAYGAGGNDTLTCIATGEPCFLDGGTGADKLISESSTAAYMVGGSGKDAYTASPNSNDRLAFRKGDTVAGAKRDTVKGFLQVQDKLDLSLIDANTGVPGNQAFIFVASTNHPATGQVSYYKSGSNTIVVANDGSTTIEIQLLNFSEPLLDTAFIL